MKGIVLAGGTGTRLYPITLGISKQLIPIYDKPMIDYPLSVLMLSGIRDVLVITAPQDQEDFKRRLGDGSSLGMNFSYAVQTEPRGLADAFRVGKDFVGSDDASLILGDNIFYGHGLPPVLRKAVGDVQRDHGATIFAKEVPDPRRYGIAEFDDHGKVLSIEEKPDSPKSDYAITGLYFFDNDVVRIAHDVKPSKRNELEITDVIREYLKQGRLRAERLGTAYAWLDSGTPESLLEAWQFVSSVQKTTGRKIACLEEVAFKSGFIDREQLVKLAEGYNKNSDFRSYLSRIAMRENPLTFLPS